MLIENQTIAEVVSIEAEKEVEELILEYIEWNPINLEHYFVSPGMIDCNIRRNEQWESVEEMTKEAVAGGVTLCVEETTLNSGISREAGPRYCDTGSVTVVDTTILETLTSDDVADSYALKGYLTPPNDSIGGLFNLQQSFSQAAAIGLPLLLDPSIAEPKVLFLASPCRLVSLQQRKETQIFADQKLFGGAFSTETDSDDSYSDEEEDEDTGDLPSPRSWKTQFSYEEAKYVRKLSMKQDPVPHRRAEPRLQTLGHIPDFALAPKNFKNILSALEEKIDEQAENLESLCKAEMMAYQGVGQTTYESQEVARNQPPEETRVRRRPPPLASLPPPARFADAVYLKQLANYPDSMEARGVRKILEALKSTQCQIHITNLSSAKAVSLIQKAKEEKVEITCETCPHFLFFTDLQVPDGDTRLKNFPPIRNKSNCNFLWELMKLNAIDTVCSQHTPVSPEFKFRPNFRKAVPGISALGFSLQVLWTLLKSPIADPSNSEHYLIRLAKWTSSNPARILRIPNRGAIEKGFLADLVIWEPFEEMSKSAFAHSQCPYVPAKLYGKVAKVFIRGKLAYSGEELYPVGCSVSPLASP